MFIFNHMLPHAILSQVWPIQSWCLQLAFCLSAWVMNSTVLAQKTSWWTFGIPQFPDPYENFMKKKALFVFLSRRENLSTAHLPSDGAGFAAGQTDGRAVLLATRLSWVLFIKLFLVGRSLACALTLQSLESFHLTHPRLSRRAPKGHLSWRVVNDMLSVLAPHGVPLDTVYFLVSCFFLSPASTRVLAFPQREAMFSLL